MTEFKQGQRVHVAFDAMVVSAPSDDRIVVKADSRSFANTVSREDVTLAEPANWPPQVGDIWEADGTEWFVRCQPAQPYGLWVTPARAETGRDVDELLELNPTLIRRRDAIVLRMLDDE